MAVGHQDFTQKKPDQLVYLELGVGNGGMLLTVSEDGFRFRAVSPVRANGTMPFAFSLDGRNRLEGEGTVEWVEEDGKSGGMRFTQVSPEFRAALADWLNSDSSQHAGREVVPAAATPLDTMEKIRQELRSGYPERPAELAPPAPAPAGVAEQKPQPVIRPHTASAGNVPEKNRPDKNFAEKVVPEQKPKPTIFARRSEKISDSNESLPANRLFPLRPANPADVEKPAAASSAFLKPSMETKTSLASPTPVVTAHSVEPAFPRSPAKRETPYTPASSVLFGTAPRPVETHVPAAPPATAETLFRPETIAPSQARPFIPPLEDSFEQAWDRAKINSPSDSPHFSRAAAGGIIVIALVVILGALAYNFRQDIGSIFIQLGQSISGDNHTAAPAPVQDPKPDATPPEQQNQTAASERAPSQTPNTATESGSGANPLAGSASTNTETGAATSGTSGTKGNTGAPPVVKAPAIVKPPENSAPGISIDRAAKNGATADVESGQEEFGIARDILRGSNRQRDLSRAVELLWSSVKKGHVPAEVTLADLYRRGDGVEKNCDQARVLLVAASKKGSLDAREMLEKIAEHGCE